MSIHIVRRRVPEDAPLLASDLHPILARVYAARQVTSPDELQYGLEHLPPVQAMKGIDTAVRLLSEVLRAQGRILVIGDFDADGATSSALAVRALRLMGAAQVDFLVPNRFEYGYGLTPEIVAVAQTRQPDLIITVDNGIASNRGVLAATQAGMRVLITDHHLPGATLPAADAIVNPNQPGDAFPVKTLAGVGVIFYVMLALRAQLRQLGWFAERGIDEPNLAQLLDLVALGTVADVVPLEWTNRILVAQGLARIRQGQCCAGIKALLEVAGRNMASLVAADLGFALGPRLNAAGRLEDMSLGIECLLCDEPQQARALAQRLDQLNRERRLIEADMQAQAVAALEQMQLASEALPNGLCLYNPQWHQGVIGILASRIKEQLHRPVITFAQAGEGMLKGSGRSVAGLHLRDALDAIATRHPALLSKFGGHAMAAGLSIREEDFDVFSQAFAAEVCRHLSADELQGVIHSDGSLPADELNMPLAKLLQDAGPWGHHFPEPCFDDVFEVVSRRVVGTKHLKLALRARGVKHAIDAIAFNCTDETWPAKVEEVSVAYRLGINEYQGRRTLQLLVEQISPIN